jgi:4-hydroxythreonine-4-phosphate dehydrogenase
VSLHRPRTLLLTPGMGVGPELSLRVLHEDGHQDVVLIGRRRAVEAAGAFARGLRLVELPLPEARAYAGAGLPFVVTEDGDEPAEAAAVRLAAEALLRGPPGALITGPIHKKRLAERGFRFQGHTDFLAHICGVPDEEVMAFVGGELRVALVTTHIPLSAVPAAITAPRLRHVITTATSALHTELGLHPRRVLVCGLNPHAGEEGLLGREELDTIGPVCAALVAEGWPVEGPVSAETAFMEARAGRSELVVAMYHDQGLAPLKAVDFGRSVNWSLGLPIVRTSVDHGTADALVGTGRAQPHSTRAALALARQIVRQRGWA